MPAMLVVVHTLNAYFSCKAVYYTGYAGCGTHPEYVPQLMVYGKGDYKYLKNARLFK